MAQTSKSIRSDRGAEASRPKSRRVLLFAVLFLVLLVTGPSILKLSGCFRCLGTHSWMRSAHRLDADRTIVITCSDSRYPIWTDPELSRYTLSISVQSGVAESDGSVLAFHPGIYRLKLGDLVQVPAAFVVRANDERNKVWIVDTQKQKVIGTYNLETGEGSGNSRLRPDWATLDGGVVLEKIPSSDLE